MSIHREPNATLLGHKILVVSNYTKKGPSLLATRGRDRGQYMIVCGNPAYAVIDIKLKYIKKRK